MIIDGHCHIGPPVSPGEYVPLGVSEGTVERLIAYMDKHKIDMAGALPFPQIGIDLANQSVSEAIRRFPERLIGFGTCNPWFKNAADTVRRSYEVLGLKGLKLHPFIHGYPLSIHTLTDPVYKVCAELQIPILSHGGDDIFNHPYEFEEMGRVFPEVIQIIGHMGSMYLCDQARLVAKRNKNIYLDATAVFTGDIRMAVAEVGADKVIMGSDWPTGSTLVAIEKVNVAVENPDHRQLILGDNIARIFGLARPAKESS